MSEFSKTSSHIKKLQDSVQPQIPEGRPVKITTESEPLTSSSSLVKTNTPCHFSMKNHDRNRRLELALRQRSQSLSSHETSPQIPNTLSLKVSPLLSQGNVKMGTQSISIPVTPGEFSGNIDPQGRVNTNKTLAIVTKSSDTEKISLDESDNTDSRRLFQKLHTPFPALPDPKSAPEVEPAPASGMYWSAAPLSGDSLSGIRAHTSTLIGSNIYIFGGCDSRCCFNDLSVLDADSFYLSSPLVCGTTPAPLRAMTCTAVGKKLIIFGGGDGPTYYNDVYVLDTLNFRWSKPRIGGDRYPSKRRAHTACLWRNGIYVFGGGDGVRALNDVWRLDVADIKKMSWKLVSAPSLGSANDKSKPKARGYHTANMVSNKLIIFGGSDGGDCFQDVWVFDVDTLIFTMVNTPVSFPRLSHTSTIVGSYLFVIGGHDGIEYSNEVLLLNLVTMLWDKRRIYGLPPQKRGYHCTVLHDSRLIVIGGFDGREVFSDVHLLELAVYAYYSQISHFSIDV
ncbi:Tip elongation aberrant protein 1 [Golovinomyces cichoracearum]|uniref:Tip elongation aberrant protein 1 n=1 Tax=Golovinomyces cichoracearum TaxID=62708 RepID=A0A420J4C2_9PEZI|nr:Tip elongation aberrant protein 1 [Golovinomyces cichoracearum]